jgi:hypothetical protein
MIAGVLLNDKHTPCDPGCSVPTRIPDKSFPRPRFSIK